MKYAIQESGNGPIILKGEPLTRLLQHLQVNPTRTLVVQRKGVWVPWKEKIRIPKTQVTHVGSGRINRAWSKAWGRGEAV